MIDNTDLRYKKPSEDIILDLIWYSVGLRIPPGMVTFGLPEAFEPYPSDSIQRNTVVSTTGVIKDTRYFKGEQRLRYRRLKLSDLKPLEGKVFEIDTFPTTTFEILATFNEVFGLMLSEDDVENDTYQIDESVTIRASQKSLVWIGEIEVINPYIDLITVNNLSGFIKHDPFRITKSDLDGFRKISS